jgi:hypothetical protein
MNITNKNAREIAVAIQAVSAGYGETVEGKNQQRSYALGFKATYALARNASALRPITDALDETRKALVKRLGDEKDGNFTVRAECMAEFASSMEGMDTATAGDVALHQVKASDLECSTGQQIPSAVLALLLPLILEENA